MKIVFLICTLIFYTTVSGQSIDTLLSKYNSHSVPYISVEELKNDPTPYLILDTRKRREYEVSHIPKAVWASKNVLDSLKTSPNNIKTTPVVVYCSVGVRSEDVGENLIKNGFTNVQNLYGSIFAWKDRGYDVVNKFEQTTDSVHVFSKTWSKYLKTGTKVY